MANIKNCPFCGGEAKFRYCTPDGRYSTDELNQKVYGVVASHYIIQCTKCGVRTKVYGTSKGAFNCWNRRIYDKEEVIECQQTEQNI